VIPATKPPKRRDEAKMLIVHAKEGSIRDALVVDLPDALRPGDLLIVNDAATLPASLFAKTPSGAPLEIRLLQHAGGSDWKATLLGAGDWRTPTELRNPPERVETGSILCIAEGFTAEVIDIAPDSERLGTIRFSRQGVDMWTGIYAYGRPIQYAYLKSDLALWSVQTAYASRPWAIEMPSAGRPLSWQILLELKRRNVRIAWLTHAAGISSIGDQNLDARLPFPEAFEIPQPTINAIAETQVRGGRIIAVGTTVVRALEGCAAQNNGALLGGVRKTDLVIRRGFRPSVVNGLLTGLHDPTETHFQLLEAFADEMTLRTVWRHATSAGYLCHEFGDVCLIV